MNNTDSFEDANIKDVESFLDDNLEGFTKDALKDGNGIRYYDGKGNSFQLNNGYENFTDPTHDAPYLKISQNGQTIRIPLTK